MVADQVPRPTRLVVRSGLEDRPVLSIFNKDTGGVTRGVGVLSCTQAPDEGDKRKQPQAEREWREE